MSKEKFKRDSNVPINRIKNKKDKGGNKDRKEGQISKLNGLLAYAAQETGRSIRDLMKELRIPRSDSKATTKTLSGHIGRVKEFIRRLK